MQGKFDSSQSRSTSFVRCSLTFLLHSRYTEVIWVGLRLRKLLRSGQRATVMLAVVDPATVTACVAGLPTSLHVFRGEAPSEMSLITKFPSLSVTAKYGVGATTT